MAGHSKWKNIQHRKGRQDAIRGKLFAKLSREIYVAARNGDPDPNNNHQLRLAVAKAKAQNMPNENIERAIQKAVGGSDHTQYESIVYEGYGPQGVAVMVDVLTDNRNRTAADLRHIFSKRGGKLAVNGSVSWMFTRQGELVISRDNLSLDEEEMLLLALDLGAEDYTSSEKEIEIITTPETWADVKSGLESAGVRFSRAEITMVAQENVILEGDELMRVIDLVESLEEHDDVQNVYANFDMP